MASSNTQSGEQDWAAAYIIGNALWAHTLSSTRYLTNKYKIDHHVNPRENLDKYGPRAVSEGKITQAQLDRVKRMQSAHANSMEHFPLFAAAIILAKVASLPSAQINSAGLYYTIFRLAYFANYVLASTQGLAMLRPLLWWGSNIVCFRLIWSAGKAFNGV